jgi:hypothetical protein
MKRALLPIFCIIIWTFVIHLVLAEISTSGIRDSELRLAAEQGYNAALERLYRGEDLGPSLYPLNGD